VHHFIQLSAAAKKMEFDRLRAGHPLVFQTAVPPPTSKLEGGGFTARLMQEIVYEFPRDTSSIL